MNLHQILETGIAGGYIFRVLSYAAQTAPIPQNPWAKWAMGIVQYAFINLDKAKQHFNSDGTEKGNASPN